MVLLQSVKYERNKSNTSTGRPSLILAVLNYRQAGRQAAV